MTTLAILTPIDPGTNSRVTVRVCSSQDSAATGADNQIWWPAIVEQPVLSMSLFDGDFTGAVEPASANIALRVDVLRNSGQFARVERYDWSGAGASIYRLVGGAPVLLAEMRVERFAAEDDALALSLAVDQEPFEADILFNEYAGTTGAEGGADLKGQPKPWAFGRCLNVEPVFVDQIDNVFQVSGYGPIEAISAVYERGASFGGGVGDFANYAALVAADIPEGRWGTCLAEGMFRLGAPPAGIITCDVDGDNTGGFLRRTGAVVKQIASRLDLSAKVNAASLDALDVAVPYNANFYIGQQITLLDFARQVTAPCNAVAGIDLDGRLITPRVAFASEELTLDAQGRQMPPVLGMARQNTSPPYKRIQMGAARSWRVHTFDEIAFFANLIDRGLYSASEVYREGNIVESADKSRWVYVNPTASSGNAPPEWPTASDSYWSNIAPPLAPADIGLEEGATRNVAQGPYDNATTYIKGDEVLFNGSTYRLTIAGSTGFAPPDTRWALVAEIGQAGIAVVVTNESHVVQTDNLGDNGDYTDAGGQMLVYRGTTQIGAAFSVASQTPNTGWITIDPVTGVYTVTDPGNVGGQAVLRATVDGVDYDRRYSLGLARAGNDGSPGPSLRLNASALTFTFDGNNALLPSSQTITFTAVYNYPWTITWVAQAFNSSGTLLAIIVLGGSGDTRTLTGAQFNANPNTAYVRVIAQGPGIQDRVQIVRLTDGAEGAGGLSGFLTNESAVLAATADGTVSDLSPASGEFKVFLGTEEVTTGVFFTVVSNTGCVASISLGGNYSISSISADNAEVVFRAETVDYTIDKVLTISKARAGGAGAAGLNNATVTLYRRNATLPTKPSTTATYTFATGALTGQNNSWTQAVPASDGNPLWITAAVASATTATDTIAGSEWTTPVILVQNGEDGLDGVAGFLTNEAVTLQAFANGNVVSYAGASGEFKIFSGNTDVSSSFTLSTVANPQSLTIGYSGRTYTVSGAGASTGQFGNSAVDTASLTIRATGSGAYSGVVIDKVFTLAKTKGGYEIVSSLPATNLFEGRVVFLTTDDKLYRYTGSAWAASVPATDITGELTDAQIESIGAAKLTGQITSTQITDDAITTPKLAAGAVTAAEIAAGAIVADKIAANAVTSTKIEAGAITTAKLAASAVTADTIAAGAITAAKLATTELITVSAQIADGVITNAKIANLDAGKITTGQLAAARIDVDGVFNAAGSSTFTGNLQVTGESVFKGDGTNTIGMSLVAIVEIDGRNQDVDVGLNVRTGTLVENAVSIFANNTSSVLVPGNTAAVYVNSNSSSPTIMARNQGSGPAGVFIGPVGIGIATPNAAALLHLNSTSRGFLPPVMTTAQRDAISSPPNGLMLYNSTTDKLQVRAAGAWVDLH